MALFTIANKIQLACSWACNSNGQCSLLLLRTILKFQSFRLIWSLFHITYFGEWGNFISLWIVNWRFLLLFKSDTSNWLTFLCTNLGEYWSFPSKATVCLFIDFKQTNKNTHHFLHEKFIVPWNHHWFATVFTRPAMQPLFPAVSRARVSCRIWLSKKVTPKRETLRGVKLM